MSYKVLYRKYRPQTFADIVDQNFITDTLKESIINNRISHAYIFSGPKGTGKTSTAKVLAKAINCESPVDGEPCGKCESCKNFSSSPDIIELDAASNNKVEDIREIVNNVKLSPSSSKYKIYIIDEVHMLTPSAANAFLLTLEEPPQLSGLLDSNVEKYFDQMDETSGLLCNTFYVVACRFFDRFGAPVCTHVGEHLSAIG